MSSSPNTSAQPSPPPSQTYRQSPEELRAAVKLLREEVSALGAPLGVEGNLDDKTIVNVSLQVWDHQRQEGAPQERGGSVPSEIKAAGASSDSLSVPDGVITCFGLKPYPINLGKTLANDAPQPVYGVPEELSDDFTITDLLGEGGMGRVYGGIQTCLNREVALKIAKHDHTDQRIRAQVIHEAQVTALLEHPHIMPVHLLAVERSGQVIQVLKRVSGVSWHELLHQPLHPHWSKLQVPEGQQAFHLDVLAQVCSALGYAHERGVIHRDIKPENIMVGRFGEVYVLDWGVALVLDAIAKKPDETPFKAQVSYGFAELLVGTLAYMSPEMARREVAQYGAQCDVYLLGATLYELLCGRRIREERPPEEIFQLILSGALPPRLDELPRGFASLIRDALSTQVNDRPRDATEFRDRLLSARRDARAQEVIREAHDFTAELNEGITEGVSIDQLTALYDEARLSYRAALALGAIKSNTLADLDALYSMWARHLITLGELNIAEQVLSSRDQPDSLLAEELASAITSRAQRDQEHRALRAWSADEAFASSRHLRFRLALLGLALFGGGSLTLDTCERFGYLELTSYDEFLAAASLSTVLCLTFLGVMKWRALHAYEQNAVFSRLWQYLLLTMALLSVQRFISWRLDLTPAQLIHLEMPLLALSCFGLSSISQQRDFVFGGVAFFIMSALSVKYPELTTLLYAIAMTMLWVGVLIAWRREPNTGRAQSALN